jgi:hypothetical protein
VVLRREILVAAGCGFAYFLLDFAAICIRKLLICLNALRVPVNSKPVTHPIPLADGLDRNLLRSYGQLEWSGWINGIRKGAGNSILTFEFF